MMVLTRNGDVLTRNGEVLTRNGDGTNEEW